MRKLFHRIFTVLMVSGIAMPAALAGTSIEHWQTDNGGRVYYVHAPQLPIVDMRLIFDAGSARDGDKHGLARLTNGLLVEGSGGLSATEMAQGFEEIGAQINHSADRDSATLGLRSLSEPEKLDRAVALFARTAQRPDFSEPSFQRDVQNALQYIKRRQQSPGSVAAIAFYAALYGEHPYAHPTTGTADSVSTLKPTDVRAFFREHYVAKNSVLVIVGDVSRARAGELAEAVYGDMPMGESAAPLPAVAMIDDASEETVVHPSSQTHIHVGTPAIGKGDPDFFALMVGNHILGGGGFTSRLVKTIRDEHGLAYSVGSQISPMRVAGPFSISLQTKNDQAEQALQLVNETLEAFVTGGPTKAELYAAKQNIIGGFPLEMDSNKKILGVVSSIAFYDYPLDYLDNYVNEVQRIKRRDIRRAYQSLLKRSELVTVRVGGE